MSFGFLLLLDREIPHSNLSPSDCALWSNPQSEIDMNIIKCKYRTIGKRKKTRDFPEPGDGCFLRNPWILNTGQPSDPEKEGLQSQGKVLWAFTGMCGDAGWDWSDGEAGWVNVQQNVHHPKEWEPHKIERKQSKARKAELRNCWWKRKLGIGKGNRGLTACDSLEENALPRDILAKNFN